MFVLTLYVRYFSRYLGTYRHTYRQLYIQKVSFYIIDDFIQKAHPCDNINHHEIWFLCMIPVSQTRLKRTKLVLKKINSTNVKIHTCHPKIMNNRMKQCWASISTPPYTHNVCRHKQPTKTVFSSCVHIMKILEILNWRKFTLLLL